MRTKITKQAGIGIAASLMWMYRGLCGLGQKVCWLLDAHHTIGCGQAVLISAGWTDAQREDKRKELRFVLDATVCGQDGTVFYYQGLHDVASVLLLVMGDKAAYQTLTHLSLCQLRDCTRYKLSLFYLHLTQRILQHCKLLPCHLELYGNISLCVLWRTWGKTLWAVRC